MLLFCLALVYAICLAKISFPEPGEPVRSSILGGSPPVRNSSRPAMPVLISFMLVFFLLVGGGLLYVFFN